MIRAYHLYETTSLEILKDVDPSIAFLSTQMAIMNCRPILFSLLFAGLLSVAVGVSVPKRGMHTNLIFNLL
jgi:hypothetical protein